MIKFLAKPYPFIHESRRSTILITLFILFFVFAFLFFFKPFDIADRIPASANLMEICAVFAICSAISYFLLAELLQHFFPNQLNEKKWTVGRELIYTNVVLLIISIVNAFAGDYYNIDEHNGEMSLVMLFSQGVFYTYMVGVFPVAMVTIVNNFILLKRNLSKVEEHNEVLQKKTASLEVAPLEVTIESQIKSNQLTVDLNRLLFIMSDGNYVEFHLEEDAAVVREIQRNTLTNIEQQLSSYEFLYRSHRAFLVNLKKIRNSNGNAQGYQLSFEKTDHLVPVSRKKLGEFDQLINSLS